MRDRVPKGRGSLSHGLELAGELHVDALSWNEIENYPYDVLVHCTPQGPLADTVFQLLGGLRSGMGYVGAVNLTELREKARFVQITSGGLRESHAHDITITEEPVNYQQST